MRSYIPVFIASPVFLLLLLFSIFNPPKPGFPRWLPAAFTAGAWAVCIGSCEHTRRAHKKIQLELAAMQAPSFRNALGSYYVCKCGACMGGPALYYISGPFRTREEAQLEDGDEMVIRTEALR